jgi:hypothetical protein
MRRLSGAVLLAALFLLPLATPVKTAHAAAIPGEAPSIDAEWDDSGNTWVTVRYASGTQTYARGFLNGAWTAWYADASPAPNSWTTSVTHIGPDASNGQDFITDNGASVNCGALNISGGPWSRVSYPARTLSYAGPYAFNADHNHTPPLTGQPSMVLYSRLNDSHIMFTTVSESYPCDLGATYQDFGGVSYYAGAVVQESHTAAWSYRVFVTGTDGTLWTNLYCCGTYVPYWQGWVQLPNGGHSVQSVGAMVWHRSDGTLRQENIFVRGTDDQLWTTSSTDGINWTSWQGIGGVLRSGPGCAGYLDSGNAGVMCAVVGTDGNLWARIGTAYLGWGPWNNIGSPF